MAHGMEIGPIKLEASDFKLNKKLRVSKQIIF